MSELCPEPGCALNSAAQPRDKALAQPELQPEAKKTRQKVIVRNCEIIGKSWQIDWKFWILNYQI